MAMTEWDDAEFARHCARLRQLKQERGWLTEAECDDLETELQNRSLPPIGRGAEERVLKDFLGSRHPHPQNSVAKSNSIPPRKFAAKFRRYV
jgi:hypothetical protein